MTTLRKTKIEMFVAVSVCLFALCLIDGWVELGTCGLKMMIACELEETQRRGSESVGAEVLSFFFSLFFPFGSLARRLNSKF